MSTPLDETRRTYDVIAPEYARMASKVHDGLVADAAWVASRLPPGAWVAEVGCGPGRDVRLLRDHGLRVIGLDLSLGQLLAGGLPGMVRADMRRLPVRTAAVDAVWCQAALLHVPREYVPEVLDGFARVVRPGGLLHLVVAEGDGEGFEAAANYDAADHRRWFTYHREADLTTALAQIGFQVCDSRRNRSHRDWLTLRAVRR